MHHTIRLSQMRIGVDLDGVVADFTHGWTSQYKKELGKKSRKRYYRMGIIKTSHSLRGRN